MLINAALIMSSVMGFMPLKTSCVSSTLKKSIIFNLSPPSDISLSMASNDGKGFGKNVNKPSAKKNVVNESTEISNPTTNTDTPTTSTTNRAESSVKTAGADALARLRRQQAEQKDEELRAIREMKAMEKYVSDEPDAAVIPEQVAQRMGKRMLPFVGIPLFGVMGTFVLFWYMATYRNMEFQPALVAFSTIGVLGVSLLVSKDI